MIQAKLTKLVLIRRRFLRLMERIPHFIDGDGVPQRGIGLVPVRLARPVRVIRKAEDNRIKTRIDLPAFQHIQRFLVYLPADAVAVGACCRKEKP